ncbi:MAG: hypothetical protein JNM78_09915 [Cyclobacteriaceae bacterium]|nr:hypothetical protein [Cyclobacteriaceae bacterium]
MRKKSVYRGFLIAAGLVASVVIILSHAYSLPVDKETKAATEQTEDSSKTKTISAAPSDAMTQGSLVRVNEQVPVSILEILGDEVSSQEFIPRTEAILSNLFKVLFQVVIAPNAP